MTGAHLAYRNPPKYLRRGCTATPRGFPSGFKEMTTAASGAPDSPPHHTGIYREITDN
jgi:hypothetical protein